MISVTITLYILTPHTIEYMSVACISAISVNSKTSCVFLTDSGRRVAHASTYRHHGHYIPTDGIGCRRRLVGQWTPTFLCMSFIEDTKARVPHPY